MIPIITTEERGTFIGRSPICPSTIATKKSAGIADITIRLAEHFTVFNTFDMLYFLV